MPSYSRLIVPIVCGLLSFSSVNAVDITQTNETDMLMMSALDNELHLNYQKSAVLYAKLFSITQDRVYLDKAIAFSLKVKDFDMLGQCALQGIDKFNDNEKYYRYYVISLMQQMQLNDALKVSKRLLEKYNNGANYDLVGNIYYAKGDYNNAVVYFESAYGATKSAKTLVSLADVLFVYLKEKQKAISYLETYIRLNGCDERVCDKLISFYQEQQNIDGMISIMKMKLANEQDPLNAYKISRQLEPLLEKKDIHLAISFLETNPIDNTRLLTLYQTVGENKKALILVRKMYKKTRDKALLGYIAILEHELAHDKLKVMDHVIANFEIALKYTDNPSFKNYYGYILIEYNLDVQKGLKLVKEALKEYPTNVAYMDSVAWGYYKLRDYKTAYKYMKQVVDQIGLDNSEIKDHWEKISNKVNK